MSNEPTRAKPEGWYASHDKRAKYTHFFRGDCGKPMCGKRTRQDKRAAYPLPEGSVFELCPECLWWYQNIHKPKVQPAKV